MNTIVAHAYVSRFEERRALQVGNYLGALSEVLESLEYVHGDILPQGSPI